MSYRTRYAPTPSGAMHLGHARTALVAWLRARAWDGTILMRIEDLDPPRVREGSEASILADHEWLGLDWDEGPVHQSARFDRYEAVLTELGERVFDCTCTRKELQESQAPHGAPNAYPGTCREGPTHPERPAAKRFRAEGSLRFRDALYGEVEHPLSDFVVRRSDGLWAYQLAVVVDDHDMGITEVVRGADLLESTPMQVALHEALGWQPPAWLHVPLVLGADGARLAKRHGAVGIGEYREAGWSSERVLGMLAHSLGLRTDDSPVDLETLCGSFALDAISREPVTLDPLTASNVQG